MVMHFDRQQLEGGSVGSFYDAVRRVLNRSEKYTVFSLTEVVEPNITEGMTEEEIGLAYASALDQNREALMALNNGVDSIDDETAEQALEIIAKSITRGYYDSVTYPDEVYNAVATVLERLDLA